MSDSQSKSNPGRSEACRSIRRCQEGLTVAGLTIVSITALPAARKSSEGVSPLASNAESASAISSRIRYCGPLRGSWASEGIEDVSHLGDARKCMADGTRDLTLERHPDSQRHHIQQPPQGEPDYLERHDRLVQAAIPFDDLRKADDVPRAGRRNEPGV